MTKNDFFIILAALVIFLFGGITGYKIKKCPKIESSTTKIDTFYQGYPVVDTMNISYPVSKILYRKVRVLDTVWKYDTILGQERYVNVYVSEDTLRYKSIFVAISDTGDCDGIRTRSSTFGGELEGRVVIKEITNNVSIPPPFVSLYAGASASFSGRWKAFDVGPSISVSIRQKHNIGYTYGLNTSTHNLTLQTRIR